MKNEMRILLLEDSVTDAGLIRHTLRQGGFDFSLEHVENKSDFLRQLDKARPDLILSDFSLPSIDGHTALALARKKRPDTPFIFVTGTLGEEVAIETLKKGATDYVLKHRLSRLVPSVHRAMREAGERAERRRAERQLRESHEQLRALSVYLQHIREEERTRIAREVHDELGQALTALKLELIWLVSRLPKTLKPVRGRARLMSERIDEIIQTVRRIATELRPGLLDTAGLPAAIEWEAREFQARTGVRCHVRTTVREPHTDQDMNTAFFRIFQETLTNIIRHAEATRVEVRLSEANGHLVLEVKDNGRGISEEEIQNTKSIGLVGMRERAALLGGEVCVHGEPGHGTTVRVRIPQIRKTSVHTKLNRYEHSYRRRPRSGATRLEAYSG